MTQESSLWKVILQTIKRTIQIHGPIKQDNMSSLAKRIVEAIWDLKERQEVGTQEHELNKLLADTMGVFAAAKVGALKVKNDQLRQEVGPLKREINILKQKIASFEKKKYEHLQSKQTNEERNHQHKEEVTKHYMRVYELNKLVENLTQLMELHGLKRHYKKEKPHGE